MKKVTTILLAIVAFASLDTPRLLRAQTITIDSVSATTFCAGDPIAVSFTVSGGWVKNNAFTLQLSDTGGSFDVTFTSLGSVIDTAAGTFTIVSTLPLKAWYSDHYRVRVIGVIDAAPGYVSAGNGSDLLIGLYPLKYKWAYGAYVAVGIPHTFDLGTDVGEPGVNGTIYLDYGDGASPRTQTLNHGTVPVTYSTIGLKMLVSRDVTEGGCSISDTAYVYAYDCTPPQIPHDAIIVSSNNTKASDNKAYWVNPGLSFNAGYSDTIFAETGASIAGLVGTNSQQANIVYLKPGAISDIDYDGVVLYAPGASVDNSNPLHAPTLECTGLTFDYSAAPPNSIMHINDGGAGVTTPNAQLALIEVSPNPTNGIVALHGAPANAQVQVMNVLGVAVQELPRTAESNFSLDLSKLAPGTYYIRIASNNSVTTKKIVKE